MRKFVHAYLKQTDKDGQAAAIEAGYSAKTAKVSASRLLNENEWVKAEIGKRQKALAVKFEITEETVLKGLYDEANDKGEGTTQSARVTAWGKLGTFIGMGDQRETVPPPPAPNVNVTNNVTVEKVEVRVEQLRNDLGELFDDAIEGTATEEPKAVN